MVDRWYYGQDENKNGPCSDQQLRNLADAGQILPTDTIWKEGIEKGVLANRVKNLFPPAEADASPDSKLHSSSQPAVEPPAVSQAAPPLTSPQAEATPVTESTATISKEATPQPEANPGLPTATDAATAPEESPPEKAPALPYKRGPQPEQVKKKRAVAGKGAVIIGQDGVRAKVRKKCTVCGHEDSSFATILIKNGVNRINFFCIKCKRRREVEVQGITS